MTEAELKALATGDPRIISQVSRQQTLAEMNRQQDVYQNEREAHPRTSPENETGARKHL